MRPDEIKKLVEEDNEFDHTPDDLSDISKPHTHNAPDTCEVGLDPHDFPQD